MQPTMLDIYYNFSEHVTCYFSPKRHGILNGAAKKKNEAMVTKILLFIWIPLSPDSSAGERHLNPLMWGPCLVC